MQSLLEQFIPAADEVHFLQVSKGPEGDLFRSFSEKGHYGGRAKPTNTRQGIYAVAPSGAFLASVNTRDPRAMEKMLREALVEWKALPEEDRYAADVPDASPPGRRRYEDLFPEDGLILEVTTRDLPRDGDGGTDVDKGGNRRRDWRRRAWNRDRAWFRAEEARGFAPPKPAKGVEHEVPAPLVRRLARFVFVDNVRGQTVPYPDAAVKEATLRATVGDVRGELVDLAFKGRTTTLQRGRWPVAGLDAGRDPPENERGMDLQLLGSGTLDLASGRWTAFEIVAAGLRHGGTQYNARHDDLAPAPFGAVLRRDDRDPPSRVAPACLGAYGWR